MCYLQSTFFFLFLAAQLLKVDEKKFCWALCNYCVVVKGSAVKRKHTRTEAEEARSVLASGIYYRLVDWIVNVINLKLSFTRAVLYVLVFFFNFA